MKINEFNWIAANKDSIYAKEWAAANANAIAPPVTKRFGSSSLKIPLLLVVS